MYDKLINNINRDCLLVGSYDIFTMRELVASFILTKRIRIDSSEWYYLIDELWSKLDTLRLQFFSIEEFEYELRDGI